MPDRDIRRPGRLRRWLPRAPRQVGRRGAILTAYGLIWIVLGLGVATGSGTSFGLLHEVIPAQLRGLAWVITGAVAIVFAWRPPGFHDAPGFVALYIMPAVRVLSYGLAWIDHLLPIGSPGYEQGWRFAATYAAMLAAVYICSGWPDHPRTRLPREDD